MRPQRKRRLAARLFLAYVFLEIVSYLRYRRRLARQRQPRLAYRRGSLDDLRLVLRQAVLSSRPPASASLSTRPLDVLTSIAPRVRYLRLSRLRVR